MTAARVSLWAPLVLWAGAIFALSSIPSLDTGLGIWDLVLRKLGHLVEYAILGALLARALRHPAAAFLVAAAYAVTDEVHQSFVEGRVGSPVDWGIDALGAALGVLAYARTR